MSPQQTIAHYRITAKLGEGGMGEVWRATDTKLGREVAVKVLPKPFAGDPDRMARFHREAQVLASLNHPNIAAIYGVEERALIMELVDGPTLAERIAQGRIPAEEARDIARQIAEALEYAHERGIIHRDLKPANVKLTPDGRVKVLDFGLAKALAEESPAADPRSSPTVTMRATQAGVLMGTAAYMSPEQAHGRTVDRRADIWAFGVVLYEMLTGRMAFTGESISDTLASVLKFEPDWSLLPADTAPALRSLLQGCLRKDLRQRLQAIGDARIALEEAEPEAAAAVVAAPAGLQSRWPLITAAALGIVSIVLGAALWRVTRPHDAALMQFSVDLGPESMGGPLTPATLSPDGSRMVFPGRAADGEQRLYIRTLSQPNATPIRGAESVGGAFFSPDGQWIGFWSQGKIRKIPVNGGPAVTLAELPDAHGESWAEDGSIIAGTTGGGLFRIPAGGGPPQVLTDPATHGERSHSNPQVLPGGEAVLFTANTSPLADAYFEDAQIDVLFLKTGQWKTVLRGGYSGRYLPSGHLVFIHAGTMFGVPFDLKEMETRGAPVPLLEDVGASPTSGSGEFDFSQTGIFLYASGSSSRQQSTIAWMDRAGKVEPLLTAAADYRDPHLSPDGKSLAFSRDLGATQEIQVYDLGRQTITNLTFSGRNRQPVWAPDGNHLVYDSAGTPNALWWIRADGAGEPVKLLEGKDTIIPYSFSPDGGRLAYTTVSPAGGDIWIMPLDTTDPERPKPGQSELFLGTPANEYSPAFSPDGRWISYESSDRGARPELYVRPSRPQGAAVGGKWLISGGRFVRSHVWSPKRNELIYATFAGNLIAVPFTVKGDAFLPDKEVEWPGPRIMDPTAFSNFDVSRDGSRVVVFPRAEAPDQGKGVHVTVLLNFFDEVKRRIPVK